MIGAMKAAPDAGPRTRLDPLLVGGAVVVTAAAGLAAAAWWGLPLVAPEWVCAHSPWVDPAMRATVALRSRGPYPGQDPLLDWMCRAHARPDDLSPYLGSKSHMTRWVALNSVSALGQFLPHSPATEQALLRLLDDPDSGIRGSAADSLKDPASITVLEKHRRDPDKWAADSVREAILRLGGPQVAPAP